MQWNQHYDLQGKHAFLGASNYHWLNYDDEKLDISYTNYLAKEKGTRLHELAQRLIDEKVELPRSRKTLNMYVNDGIRYHMNTEQVLRYSNNCFGTADTIIFNDSKKFLRIHDLKTGNTPTHIEQLEIYASLFCLEYGFEPNDIFMELRIYQSNDIFMENNDTETYLADKINAIMSKIIIFDKRIQLLNEGE